MKRPLMILTLCAASATAHAASPTSNFKAMRTTPPPTIGSFDETVQLPTKSLAPTDRFPSADVQKIKKRGKKQKDKTRPSVVPYVAGAVLLFNGREYWCENGAKPYVHMGKVYCPVN